ncbi:MAG: radical SAM protein [Desulfovibrionaceae bacterium]
MWGSSSFRSAWTHVRGFERLSLCDWPGHTSSVVFLGGCSMRCPTCHNADLAWRPEWLPVYPRELIEQRLAAHRQWLDGIVVTGGEPTEAFGLAGLLRDLHAFGLPIKLDTNGMQPHVVAALLTSGLADAFSVDVKGPWSKYPQLTGNQVSAEQAKDRLERIFLLAGDCPRAFRFRITQVPCLTDEDIAEAQSYLPKGFSLTVQRYVPPRRTHAPTDSQTRWMPGDVVGGPHRSGHSQGAQGKRDQGSPALETVGAQS